ncbi:hypothetical protein [Ideonella sp. YS5]|uniref:hypothetical protein n=1 Tax=Ideonella sp. YS5 TaxID=3453714 RepID=UPI003EF016D2
MQGAIETVPSTVWNHYGKEDGLFDMAIAEVPAAGEESALVAYEKLSGLLKAVQANLRDLANKIFDNVSSKTLKVPKPSEIAQAVKDQQAASEDADKESRAFAKATIPAKVSDAGAAKIQELDGKAAAANARLAVVASEIASAPPKAAAAAAEQVKLEGSGKSTPALRTNLAGKVQDFLRCRQSSKKFSRNSEKFLLKEAQSFSVARFYRGQQEIELQFRLRTL